MENWIMNRKQKTCLLVSITAIVVMGLFPPWVIQTREINRCGSRVEYKYTTEPGPYSWIGTPPFARLWMWSIYKLKVYKFEDSEPPKNVRPRFIDLYRLGLQYFVVAVVTAGLIITLRDRKTG